MVADAQTVLQIEEVLMQRVQTKTGPGLWARFMLKTDGGSALSI